MIPSTTLNAVPNNNNNNNNNNNTHLSSIASLKGNLHKICFQKKRLRASLKHWINSKLGNAKCVPSHGAYLEKARADGYDIAEPLTTNTNDEIEDHAGEETSIPNRHKLLHTNALHDFTDTSCIDPDNFLDVYLEGVLYLGVVLLEDHQCETTMRNSSDDNRMDTSAVWMCAARLYRHLLWKKCLLDQPATSTAYGFVVTCERGSSAGYDDFLVTHKLYMDLSSSVFTTTDIGFKVPLQVESHLAPISPSGDSKSAAMDLLNDLGTFLLSPRRSNENKVASARDDNHRPSISSSSNSGGSSSTFLYPGPAMLLPEVLRQRLQQKERDKSPSPPRYTVLPTITGSLVIRCHDLAAVKELVPSSELRRNHHSSDSDPLVSTDAWYVKCKTPLLYGPFWETSKVAINGTRRRLQLLLGQPRSRFSEKQQELQQVAKIWLFMHPFDAMHESHRSVIVVRDMGNVFKGQLGWKDFVAAFQSMLEDTLLLQDKLQLVHGDIHAGNVLLYKPSEQAPKLLLVDWDEAAREKPFHRNTKTEKEKRQYPAALINFPDLYTKHQLQLLFEFYIKKYYTKSGDGEAWPKFVHEYATSIEQGFQDTVRHRHKMLCAFLHQHTTEI
ncbi:MAG: hypothetical protein SGBAC_003025 [Bacillariaceae sp.]